MSFFIYMILLTVFIISVIDYSTNKIVKRNIYIRYMYLISNTIFVFKIIIQSVYYIFYYDVFGIFQREVDDDIIRAPDGRIVVQGTQQMYTEIDGYIQGLQDLRDDLVVEDIRSIKEDVDFYDDDYKLYSEDFTPLIDDARTHFGLMPITIQLEDSKTNKTTRLRLIDRLREIENTFSKMYKKLNHIYNTKTIEKETRRYVILQLINELYDRILAIKFHISHLRNNSLELSVLVV